MAKSKFDIGDLEVIALNLGDEDIKAHLGDTLLYPLSKPIDDAVVTCASATYNGSNQVAQDITVTLSGVTLVENTDYTVTQNTGGTNAGSYTVTVSGMGDYESTASGTFTINKVTPTVTAPTAVTGLVYNATAQALANAGSTNFGTLKYSLDDSTYTTNIPSGTNATSYTIYYRVDGDSNVNSVAASSISNSIAKVTPTVVSPVPNVLTYNGSAQELVTAGSTNFGTLKYKAGSDSWSTSIPTRTRGGAYAVYFKVDGDSNVNSIAEDTVACSINEKPVTAVVTLSPASYTYSGSHCEPSVTVKDGETIIDPSEYTVTYSNNLNAGTATVTIYDVVGGDYYVTGSTTFTISKADPTYTAPTTKTGLVYNASAQALLNAGSATGGTIYYSSDGSTWGTAIPSGTNATSYTSYWKITGDANHNDKASASIATSIAKVTPTVVPPTPVENLVYIKNHYQYLVEKGSTDYGKLMYSINGLYWSDGAPNAEDAGTYTVYYKVSGNTNINDVAQQSVTATIAKADPTYTAPTANNRTYDTTSKALLNAGAVTGGTLYYSSDNSTWSTTIPTQTNAGSYTTYWKITGDSNHNDKASASISTTVSAKTVSSPTITLSQDSYVYNNTARQPSATVKDGTVTIASSEYTVSYSNNTNVGTATCTITDKTGGNYTVSGSKTFTITCASCTAPTAKSLTYNGSAQALVNAGSTSFGTMVYSTDNSTWGTSVPSGTNATSYTVYWKVTGNTNVCCTASSSVACSIAKAAMTYTAPSATTYTYANTARALMSGGTANGGSVQYSTSQTGTYTTTVPTQTNAGTYTTWWKAVPDSNHSGGTNAASASTIIAKADQSAPTATGATTTYNTTATATASGGGGQGTLTWTNGNTQTTVGSKSTKAYWAGNSNYNASPYSNEVTITMNKATGSVSTAPVNTNYTYNGTARVVASAGSGTGTMYYRLGASGSFSTTMPTMTDAGSNTLYYYAAESTNYTQSTTGSITVSVQKADQAAPGVTGSTTTYPTTASATASGGGGVGSIEWESAQSQSSVGSHTTRARWSGNSNYNASPYSSYVTVQMNKAAGSVTTAPVNNNYTYNGTARAVASAGSGTGTMYYRLGTSGSFSTTMPTMTNASSSTLYYYAAASTNYEQSSTGSITVSVQKANISPTVSISNWTYGGTASNPSVAGNSGSGTVTYYYKLSSASSWSTTKPSAAGSYNIRADIAATTNYNSGTCTNNFTINKANISPTVSISNWTYGGTASNPSVAGNSGSGTVTYYYKLSTASSWSTTKPNDAGSYNIRADIAATSNYNSGTCTNNFTINKANSSLSFAVTNITVEKGKTKANAVTVNAGDGTVTYSSNNTTAVTVNNSGVVTGVGVGSATITANISSTNNYNSASTSYTANCAIPLFITTKFNVTNTSNPTSILSQFADISKFSKVEIDGVEQQSVTTGYTFSSTGEHTVKYGLIGTTSVVDYAFYQCSGLTSATIESGFTSIGIYAFAYCSGLTSIDIPNSVTSIGYEAFDGCKSLTSITIPSGVTSINNSTFMYCSGLTSIVIPSGVTSIGQYAFAYCYSLTSCTVGSVVTSIGYAAFQYCSGLTSIVFPNSVTTIGNSAFSGCKSLTSCTIGTSVTSISYGAFQYCSGLTRLNSNVNGVFNIPSGVTIINNRIFAGCDSLTSIVIPSGVTSIGDGAFSSCDGLTSITIPNSVTKIGSSTFDSCTGLTSIVIPSGVTSIGDYAFNQCSNLITITSNATTAPTIQSYTFCNVHRNGTLYVPRGSNYNTWMSTSSYYLGKYNWTKVEQ